MESKAQSGTDLTYAATKCAQAWYGHYLRVLKSLLYLSPGDQGSRMSSMLPFLHGTFPMRNRFVTLEWASHRRVPLGRVSCGRSHKERSSQRREAYLSILCVY